MSPELRDNILQFYYDLSLPIETKKDGARWQAVLTELDQLKPVAPAPTVLGSTCEIDPARRLKPADSAGCRQSGLHSRLDNGNRDSKAQSHPDCPREQICRARREKKHHCS